MKVVGGSQVHHDVEAKMERRPILERAPCEGEGDVRSHIVEGVSEATP